MFAGLAADPDQSSWKPDLDGGKGDGKRGG